MNEVFGLLEAEYRAEDRATPHTLLVRLKQLKPFFGKRDAQTLTTATLKRYRDKRENEYREHSNEKIKPATVNKELQVVRAALNLAKAERKITQVPSFRGVWLAENTVRQRQVKPAEYLHLREALPTLLRRLLVLGYHTGWRASAMLNLTWDRVTDGIIRPPLMQSTKKWVGPCPIYGDLHSELEIARMERDRDFPECPWVIHRAGRKVVSYDAEWKRYTEAAGSYDLHVHDLRRSAVTNLRRLGLAQAQIMKIIGHKTDAIFYRYNIIDEAEIAEMGEDLDEKIRLEAAQREHLGSTQPPTIN